MGGAALQDGKHHLLNIQLHTPLAAKLSDASALRADVFHLLYQVTNTGLAHKRTKALHSLILLGDRGIERQGPWRPRTEKFPTEEDQNITEHVAWIRRVRTALSMFLAPRWRQTCTGNVIVKA